MPLVCQLLVLFYCRINHVSSLRILNSVFYQIPFSFNGSFTAASCCRYSLTIMWIGYISCCIYSRDLGSGTVTFSDYITNFVSINVSFENIGVRFMTNSQEEPVDRKIIMLLVRLADTLHQMDSFYTVFSIKTGGIVFIENFYLRIIFNTFLHDFAGA